MIISELKGERVEEAGSVRRKKRMPTQTCPDAAVGFVVCKQPTLWRERRPAGGLGRHDRRNLSAKGPLFVLPAR